MREWLIFVACVLVLYVVPMAWLWFELHGRELLARRARRVSLPVARVVVR